MSKFQRVKSFLAGVALLLLILILIAVPESGLSIVALILSLSLVFYGFRMLWYYAKMVSLIRISTVWIMIYLMGVFAFSGAIDILRALEAKKNGAPSWKLKFISGCISVAATIALFIIGIIFREQTILVYGYCINLGYAAVMRFVNAFRRTAIVYIQ